MKKYLFVFDVEAASLHGEGFSFGVVVSDRQGNIIDTFQLLSTEKLDLCCDFVKTNILPFLLDVPRCKTNLELRNTFYEFYMKYKDESDIYSDCNYPVETNFLEAVCKDDLENRQWNMPYPLLDIANFININVNRIDFFNKIKHKYLNVKNMDLKQHNPLDDSIASLYSFLEVDNISRL